MKNLAIVYSCVLFLTTAAQGQTVISGPLGSDPIQIHVGPDGISKKDGGYKCDLDAIGAHYSEWGETEHDGQEMIMSKCNKNSGLLLCKRDKIICKKAK